MTRVLLECNCKVWVSWLSAHVGVEVNHDCLYFNDGGMPIGRARRVLEQVRRIVKVLDESDTVSLPRSAGDAGSHWLSPRPAGGQSHDTNARSGKLSLATQQGETA